MATNYHALHQLQTPGKLITRAAELPDTRYAHTPIPRKLSGSRRPEGLKNVVNRHGRWRMELTQVPAGLSTNDREDPGSLQYPLDLSGSTPSSQNPRPITDTTRYIIKR